jgi:hypothetical protein
MLPRSFSAASHHLQQSLPMMRVLDRKPESAFKATGSWVWVLNMIVHWGFSESFTITSGSKTISGTISGGALSAKRPAMECRDFGPAYKKWALAYTAGSASGIATVGRIKKGYLRETLH